MKSVGYNEYFKSQQTGKVVERKCDVHKADYEGEDTVELGGGKPILCLRRMTLTTTR